MPCAVIYTWLVVFVGMMAWAPVIVSRDITRSEVMSPIRVIPSAVPSCVMRVPSVPWADAPESSVVPRVIPTSVIPWVVVPAAVVPRIVVPRTVSPCRICPCSVVVPRVPVAAPVPCASDAVRRVEVPRVHDAVAPVVRIFIDRHDRAAVIPVVFYCSGHVVRNQDSVLFVSEQVYFRGFGLFHKSFGLSLVLHLLGLGPDGRSIAVDPVGKPLSAVGRGHLGGCTA